MNSFHNEQSSGAQGGHQGGGAASGLAPEVGGLLAYVTWIGGLIMFLTQRHPEVRFHAAQSILYNIALVIVYIVLTVAELILTSILGILGLITTMLFVIVGIGSVVLWVILAVKGYRLEHFRLPIIGGIAEGWVR
ncbi:DUF4870 domain-containing protein [Nesterenkonia suensis]